MRNWAAAEGSEEPAPSAAAALTPGRRCSCGLGWAEPAAASPPPWQPAAPRRQRPASRPAQRPVTRDSRLGPGPARRCGRAGGHGPPRPRPAAADPPGAGGPRGALRTGGGARGLRRERGGAPALVPPPTGGARETLPRLGAPLHPQRGMKCPLRVSWPIPTLPSRRPSSGKPSPSNCPAPPGIVIPLTLASGRVADPGCPSQLEWLSPSSSLPFRGKMPDGTRSGSRYAT